MPVSAANANAASISRWRNYDAETRVDRSDPNNPKVDHGESAMENLKDAGSNLAMLRLPFVAPFLDEGLLGGPVRGAGDRAGNVLLAISSIPGAIVGGVKNGVDAAVHGVAALFD